MALAGGLLIGICVGVFSGLVGVGGGVLIIPILLYFYGMTQSDAQGTSLAILLPPTGLLAFLQYYKAGHADLKLGLFIAAGVFLEAGWAETGRRSYPTWPCGASSPLS